MKVGSTAYEEDGTPANGLYLTCVDGVTFYAENGIIKKIY